MLFTLVFIALAAFVIYQTLKQSSKDVSIFSYIKLLFYFRGKDLVRFCKEHDKLFQEAQKKNDYAEVTSHFYDVMAEVIEQAYGSSFHFSPKYYSGQSNDDALKMLHQKLAYYLDLKPGKKALELGCGVGGSLRDFALHSGAQITGISLSKEEVAENNRLNKAGKLDLLCNAIQGDMRSLPFDANTFDSVIGIYTLKYIPDDEVPTVMNQVSRVLKKGGKFLVYCLMKSEKYNKQLPEHTSVISKFEYSCGMPPIHHVSEVIEFAGKAGLKLQSKIELSQDPETAWYTVFSGGKLLMWSLQSDIVRKLIWIAEKLAILPPGFDHFLDIFVRGNVLSIVKAAQMGIMSGSEVLIFEKQ